ncbi:diacylglycerol kinase [Trichonephila clavipes]|nr:diacylglycerol kinase [Trichonephila clavipes]
MKPWILHARNIDGHQVIPVTSDDEVNDVMERALEKFGLDPSDVMKYRLSEVSLDKGYTKRVFGLKCRPIMISRTVAELGQRFRASNALRFHLSRTTEIFDIIEKNRAMLKR